MHPTLGSTACRETCIFQWLPSAHTDTCKKSKLKELIVRHAWKSTLIKAREKVVPWLGTFPGLLLWRNSSSREVPQKQFDYFFYIDFCSILFVRTCSVGLSSGSIYFKALWIFTSTRHWLLAMLCAQCNPNLLPLACCLTAPQKTQCVRQSKVQKHRRHQPHFDSRLEQPIFQPTPLQRSQEESRNTGSGTALRGSLLTFWILLVSLLQFCSPQTQPKPGPQGWQRPTNWCAHVPDQRRPAHTFTFVKETLQLNLFGGKPECSRST